MSVSKRIVNRYVSKGVSENDMNTGKFLEYMEVSTYVSTVDTHVLQVRFSKRNMYV